MGPRLRRMRGAWPAAIALLGAACAREPDRAVDFVRAPAPALAGSAMANDATQPLAVVTPPGYGESGRRWPVVYYLPGFTTDVTEYFDGTYDGLRLDAMLRRLLADGGGGAFLLVVVQGRNALGGSFYANSPLTGRWADWVADDAVRWVDAHYRTLADRDHRGVAGESMGGGGALALAMSRPDVFGSVFAISPALLDEHGLEDMGILSPPYVAGAWIEADRLDRSSRGRWAAGLARTGLELQAASGVFPHRLALAIAYGAAFAPETTGGPPWVAFPRTGLPAGPGDAAPDSGDRARIARWRAGLGDLAGKLARHEAALRSLRAIGLDAGRKDHNAWIPGGVRRFAALLDSAGIRHETAEHDGGHVDRLAGRLETRMIPFFRRVFAAAGPARGAP